MKTPTALLLLLLAALPVFADVLPQPNRPRTDAARGKSLSIAQLVKLARKAGKPGELHPMMAKELGFDKPLLPTRSLSYSRASSPDRDSHDLVLVLDMKGKPTDLIWQRYHSTAGNYGRFFTWSFRTTLSGEHTKSAVSASTSSMYRGKDEEKQSPPPPYAYETEKQLILNLAANYEPLQHHE